MPVISSSRSVDGTVTVRVSGRFNFSCYREFHEAIAGPAPSKFVVDLSSAEYLDSSALGMLLVLRERVSDDKARVAIVPGTGQPKQVLQLANFHQLFTLV